MPSEGFPDGYRYHPEPDWLTAFSQSEAWALYEANSASHGYPVPGGTDPETGRSCWRLHPYIGIVGNRQGPRMSMAEYMEQIGQVSAPPSPGGSVQAAKLKDSDRSRITDRVVKAAAKRRTEAEKEAEAARRAKTQRSLFNDRREDD